MAATATDDITTEALRRIAGKKREYAMAAKMREITNPRCPHDAGCLHNGFATGCIKPGTMVTTLCFTCGALRCMLCLNEQHKQYNDAVAAAGCDAARRAQISDLEQQMAALQAKITVLRST